MPHSLKNLPIQMPRQIWHFLHIGQTKIASHFKSEWPPLPPSGTYWGQKSNNHLCMQIFDPSVQQALRMIKWNILKLFEILSWNWYLQSEIFFIIKHVHAKARIKRDILLFLGFFCQFWKGALGPFRLGKLARKTLHLEICYSAQLWHFWSIKIQISYYTYYCHKIEGEHLSSLFVC